MEVWEKIKRDLLVFVAIMLIVQFILDLFGVGLDSTDGHRRSGMFLHTDALTGCQYLGSNSGLTPRLRPDGTQICKEIFNE